MCELCIRYVNPILGAITLLIVMGILTWIYFEVKETIESRKELERKWKNLVDEYEKKNEGSEKQ